MTSPFDKQQNTTTATNAQIVPTVNLTLFSVVVKFGGWDWSTTLSLTLDSLSVSVYRVCLEDSQPKFLLQGVPSWPWHQVPRLARLSCPSGYNGRDVCTDSRGYGGL